MNTSYLLGTKCTMRHKIVVLILHNGVFVIAETSKTWKSLRLVENKTSLPDQSVAVKIHQLLQPNGHLEKNFKGFPLIPLFALVDEAIRSQ